MTTEMAFFKDKYIPIAPEDGGHVAFGDTGGYSDSLGQVTAAFPTKGIPRGASAMIVYQRFTQGYLFDDKTPAGGALPPSAVAINGTAGTPFLMIEGIEMMRAFRAFRAVFNIQFLKAVNT